MTPEEIIKHEKEVDEAYDEVNRMLGEIYEKIDDIQRHAEELDKEERLVKQENFDKFIKLGVNIGAELQIDKVSSDLKGPFIVTGINPSGFVVTDMSSKREYILGTYYLDKLDRFHVKKDHLKETAAELLEFVRMFTTIGGQPLLSQADNGKEILEEARRLCRKARGEE